jgi:hypothetical protein
MDFYKENNKFIIQDKKSRQFGVVYLTKKGLEKLYGRIGEELGVRDYRKEVQDKIL